MTFLTHWHDSDDEVYDADDNDDDHDDDDVDHDDDDDDVDDDDADENQVVRAGSLVARILVIGEDKTSTQSLFHHHTVTQYKSKRRGRATF